MLDKNAELTSKVVTRFRTHLACTEKMARFSIVTFVRKDKSARCLKRIGLKTHLFDRIHIRNTESAPRNQGLVDETIRVSSMVRAHVLGARVEVASDDSLAPAERRPGDVAAAGDREGGIELGMVRA